MSPRHSFPILTGLAALLLGACATSDEAFRPDPVAQDSILTPGDPILAVDLDPIATNSSYPGAESPAHALDGNANSKYLNHGGAFSGLIVTPDLVISPTVLSLQLTTANDFAARDPSTFELYGTNDAISSTDNSTGLEENWTPMGSGSLGLPNTRLAPGPVVAVANVDAFSSYRLVFPQLKGGPEMQFAELKLFESADGSGPNVLAPGDAVLAIQSIPASRYPGAESPQQAIDRSANTKYLNFGELNSGFIVTPSMGPSIITAFRITTAHDAPVRDPATFDLYGTNDPITSTDNSRAMDENWTLIDSGAIALPDDRMTLGPDVQLNNSDSFRSYLFVVTAVKDSMSANSMHFSEIQFSGSVFP